MIDFCDTCCVISEMEFALLYQEHNVPHKKQCPECGAWWELCSPKTIKFKWVKRIETKMLIREAHWWRLGTFSQPYVYVPISCRQRRCGEQAHHYFKNNKKRKYKCDKHAGVCIIA